MHCSIFGAPNRRCAEPLHPCSRPRGGSGTPDRSYSALALRASRLLLSPQRSGSSLRSAYSWYTYWQDGMYAVFASWRLLLVQEQKTVTKKSLFLEAPFSYSAGNAPFQKQGVVALLPRSQDSVISIAAILSISCLVLCCLLSTAIS
jgi:hypothetical protein